MSSLLLSSKINIPHSKTAVVERTTLHRSFQNNALKKITILRAPAGYGKTTTLSHWLQQVQGKMAWMSIDPGDNDPIRYWSYILHAVAKACQTNIVEVLAPLLHSQDPAALEFLVHSFIEEIHTIEDSLHIVIDDYHLIHNTLIHGLMTQFIEQLPEQAHVYLATRVTLPLPIAKWRVKQWVHEINTEQLRFTDIEAEQLFALKETHSTYQDSIQHVMEKTEGWVAGLILVSLSIGPVTLNQDGIAQAQPYISEFMLQEIIATLPPETQQFLLHTSFLKELEPTICDHITDRTDSLELLEELERKGLFTVRLQALQPVFRYHQLFADALQHELSKQFSVEQLEEIVTQAAGLIHEKGDFISAIELALQYDLHKLAITWITEHLVELYLSGQTDTYMRWLHQIQSKRSKVTYEMLVIGFITSISIMDTKVATSLMQELEALQQTEQWMEQEEHAAIAYMYKSTEAYAMVAGGGDIHIVGEMLKKQIEKEPISSRWGTVPLPYNIFEYKLLRTSLGSKGKMPSTEDTQAISKLFRETILQTWNVAAFNYGLVAESLYERNLVHTAQQDLEIALRLGHQYHDPGLFIPMYVLKAKIYVQHNQSISAQAMLTEVIENVSEKHWITTLRIMQAYCYVIDGDIQHAEIILQATKINQPFWMLVYARFLLLKAQPAEALTLLIRVKTKAQQDEQIATILEATVLEAICYHRLGNPDTALAILHEALTLAAPFYYIRTFLDEPEILPLLDKYFKLEKLEEQWGTIPAHYFKYLLEGTKTIYEKNELLTPREQEVFDLLVDGITNRQIAQQLDLSEGTIRVYLSTIYNKLGVNSRAKAILLKKQ